jgi:integrase
MGPKVWFRLGGVPVAWRPLPATVPAREVPAAGVAGPERVALLCLIGSGLHLAELLRVRLGDLGSLDAKARILPDPRAEPLAVAFEQRRGRTAERITFLSFQARRAVLDDLERRGRAGLDTGPDAPLVAGPDGGPAGRAAVATARRRSSALIRAGNTLNVDLCRTTGEFFRSWGMPGSRFVPPEADDGGEDP